MSDERTAIYFIVSLLVCGLLAGTTANAAESDASGYLNDPFTRPSIITPYTLVKAIVLSDEQNYVDPESFERTGYFSNVPRPLTIDDQVYEWSQ